MISPKIVRVVRETVLKPNWQLDSVFSAKLRGQADEDWIMSFARSGGHALISADQKMLKRDTLIQCISETGLIGIYLPPSWAGLRGDAQLAYFIHWWRKIEDKIEAASLGTAWIVPKGIGKGEIREHSLKTKSIKGRKQSN